jgi:hypothetical protein
MPRGHLVLRVCDREVRYDYGAGIPGRLSYEVIKNLGTGQVIFRVSGYSLAAQRGATPRPGLAASWEVSLVASSRRR